MWALCLALQERNRVPSQQPVGLSAEAQMWRRDISSAACPLLRTQPWLLLWEAGTGVSEDSHSRAIRYGFVHADTLKNKNLFKPGPGLCERWGTSPLYVELLCSCSRNQESDKDVCFRLKTGSTPKTFWQQAMGQADLTALGYIAVWI